MKGDNAPPARRRSSDPQIMAALSSRAVEPAEQQSCEQVGMRKRPATYVEGGGRLFHARTFWRD
jgi:hypothetical protein